MGLGFCGMFAFLLVAGSYFGVVRSTTPLCGFRRRILDAGVGSCVAALIALAFRDSLWGIVGSTASSAGAAQFAALVGILTVPAFVIVFAVETMLGLHPEGASDS